MKNIDMELKSIDRRRARLTKEHERAMAELDEIERELLDLKTVRRPYVETSDCGDH